MAFPWENLELMLLFLLKKFLWKVLPAEKVADFEELWSNFLLSEDIFCEKCQPAFNLNCTFYYLDLDF